MKTFKINKDLYITAGVYSNSKTWGHEVHAYYRGREVASHKVRYINRTWERYQFESAMYGLVDTLDKLENVMLRDRIAMYNAIKNWSFEQ